MAEVKESKPNPIDYKSRHIQWAKQHKHTFIPYRMADLAGDTYVQLLNSMYFGSDFENIITQDYARMLFDGDVAHQKSLTTLKNNKKWFVTLGFIKDNHCYDKMIKLVRHVLKQQWVCEGSAVLEFTGEDGYRPHAHLLIEVFPCVLHKSDLKDRLKKILKSKTFSGLLDTEKDANIDMKVAVDNHDKYIKGIKTEEKQEYVDADIKFRTLHDIPHIIHS